LCFQVFVGARVVRILQGFAGICRAKLLKSFVISLGWATLDQHIGVRIPGGQPNLQLRPVIFSFPSFVVRESLRAKKPAKTGGLTRFERTRGRDYVE